MNNRSTELLYRLIYYNDFIKINDIARNMSTSERTVRYDLDRIDWFLKKNGFPKLVRKPGSGVKLEASQVYREKLACILKDLDINNYVVEPVLREKLIACELILNKSGMTYTALSQKFTVSRNTVMNDVKKLRDWLAENGRVQIAASSSGIRIEGDEEELRELLMAVFIQEYDMDEILETVQGFQAKGKKLLDNYLCTVFRNTDIKTAESTLRWIENKTGKVFADDDFYLLTVYAALSCSRCAAGYVIPAADTEDTDVMNSREYDLARNLFHEISNRNGMNVYEGEVYWLAQLLMKAAKEKDADTDLIQIGLTAERLVRNVQDISGVDFAGDSELYNGLVSHMERTIHILKDGLDIKNPLLSEVKTKYSDIFNAVNKTLNTDKGYFGESVSEDEAASIALHFVAALERKRIWNQGRYKALAVCANGIGTAKLIAALIKKNFSNIDFADMVASHKAREIASSGNYDFVVATLPVNCGDIPEIIVSPMITDEDILKIRRFISTHPPKSTETDSHYNRLVDDIMDMVQETCLVKSRKKLIMKLRNYFLIRDYDHSKEVKQPMLKELLTAENITLKACAKDWEDAVRIGGNMLVESGAARPQYIDAMIESTKKRGPYIVIAPGIAMPHVYPNESVNRVCMSLTTLEKPVEFGHEQNDPVQIIFCVGAVDNNAHIKALSEIINLLSSNEKLECIRHSTSVDEVLNIINSLKSDD